MWICEHCSLRPDNNYYYCQVPSAVLLWFYMLCDPNTNLTIGGEMSQLLLNRSFYVLRRSQRFAFIWSSRLLHFKRSITKTEPRFVFVYNPLYIASVQFNVLFFSVVIWTILPIWRRGLFWSPSHRTSGLSLYFSVWLHTGPFGAAVQTASLSPPVNLCWADQLCFMLQ